jgi:hypothetical protein
VRFLYTTLTLVFLWSGFSFANCEETLKKLSPAKVEASTFPEWRMKDQNLKLTARDLFPEDFVKEVEENVGPFQIRVMFDPKRSTVNIMGHVKNDYYVRVSLIEDSSAPQSLIVDGLNLQNPLEADNRKGLNPDQSGKGLPPQVFRYVRNKLFELSKAGGFTQIRTHSQQHFAVMMLYRKFVGMEPQDEASKAFVEEIESLYSFARKELPEELRPADVEEFTRWLGTVNSDPTGRTKKRKQILDTYFRTGELHESAQLLKNKNGKAIGVIFNDQEKAESKILFFYDHQGQTRIFDWLEVAVGHRIELIKNL